MPDVLQVDDPSVARWLVRFEDPDDYGLDLTALRVFFDWLEERGADPFRVGVARELATPAAYRGEFKKLAGLGGYTVTTRVHHRHSEYAAGVLWTSHPASRTAQAAQRVVRAVLNSLFPSRVRWDTADYIRSCLREAGLGRRLLPPEPTTTP